MLSFFSSSPPFSPFLFTGHRAPAAVFLCFIHSKEKRPRASKHRGRQGTRLAANNRCTAIIAITGGITVITIAVTQPGEVARSSGVAIMKRRIGIGTIISTIINATIEISISIGLPVYHLALFSRPLFRSFAPLAPLDIPPRGFPFFFSSSPLCLSLDPSDWLRVLSTVQYPIREREGSGREGQAFEI